MTAPSRRMVRAMRGHGTSNTRAWLGKAISERRWVADDPTGATEYLEQAEALRDAAERAFDPTIAARYLLLAAEWLRLADGQLRQDGGAAALDLGMVRQRLRSMLAALENATEGKGLSS